MENKQEKKIITAEDVKKEIKRRLDKDGKKLTVEERKMVEEGLKKVLIEGMTPKDMMGISDDFIEFYYSGCLNISSIPKSLLRIIINITNYSW